MQKEYLQVTIEINKEDTVKEKLIELLIKRVDQELFKKHINLITMEQIRTFLELSGNKLKKKE